MKVGMIGVGEMGGLMAGHIAGKGYEVHANDVVPGHIEEAVKRGARAAAKISDFAATADIFIIMVRTDAQVAEVVDEILKYAKPEAVIAVSGTHHPDCMKSQGAKAAQKQVGFVDSPVVYGMDGARDGRLLSLCGGKPEHFDRAKPVLACYSRDVLHVGPLGAGQIAKTCNNLLHWQHAVGNYEALLLAKRYGIDAQRMREVLLKSPGTNGTLERWDETRFTWHEKDMDVVMDLAQTGGLVLPLSGQVDQLIKLFHARDVAALLYGPQASYLGKTIVPLTPEEGGLG